MIEYIRRADLMRHIEDESRSWGEEYDAQQILGDIEDFPAASVRPQFNAIAEIVGSGSHGHITDYVDWRCGFCEKSWETQTPKHEYKYCPFCGANLVYWVEVEGTS